MPQFKLEDNCTMAPEELERRVRVMRVHTCGVCVQTGVKALPRLLPNDAVVKTHSPASLFIVTRPPPRRPALATTHLYIAAIFHLYDFVILRILKEWNHSVYDFS